MVLVVALIERMAPVVVEVVIVVIGVGRRRFGVAGRVSERIPRSGVITRQHFHATESASKLIPVSVSLALPLPRSIGRGRLHRDCHCRRR